MRQCKPVRWSELSANEQASFGNGCGPRQFPAWLINCLFGWFFEASCRRHDFGYSRGGAKLDKKAVDKGFYQAMLIDAKQLLTQRRYLKYIIARLISLVFYGLVAAFGWLWFEYGPYKSRDEILKQ